MLFILTFIALATAAPLQSLSSAIAALTPSSTDFETITLLLFVESLELDLYKQGCDKFSTADFVDAGFNSAMWENVCTIEIEKQAVVVDLHKLLEVDGQPIIAGCEYDFEFSNPNSWVDLANEVAMVAVGAYLGAVRVSVLHLLASGLPS